MRAGGLILVMVVATSAATTSYHGHQVWRLENLQHREIAILREVAGEMRLSEWGHGAAWLVLQVPPSSQQPLAHLLSSLSLQHKVLFHDLQSAIEEERAEVNKRAASSQGKIAFDNYNTLEQIHSYQAHLTDTLDWVRQDIIGHSIEERELVVSILSAPGDAPKTAVWIDCGIHAREWITPAVCVYGLDLLTRAYGSDPAVTALLDKYDLHMLPVQNPDGYEYTWSQDRVWRKNRVLYDGNLCYGVDLNRNYDDGHWGGVGASDDSCSDNYMGPAPFSELEPKAVRDYIRTLRDTVGLTAYFNIHSFGQMWLYAYGWSSEDNPDKEENDRVGRIGVEALQAIHNTPYELGPAYNVIYPAAGISVDFGQAEGIAHSYTLELRDTGDFGTLLPPSEILPTAEETWAGLIAALLNIDRQDHPQERARPQN